MIFCRGDGSGRHENALHMGSRALIFIVAIQLQLQTCLAGTSPATKLLSGKFTYLKTVYNIHANLLTQ